MILPKTVKVAGYVYEVVQDDGELYHYLSLINQRNSHAACDHVSSRIYLPSKGSSEDHVAECFLHELLHLLLYHYGGSESTEEHQVEALAQGLLALVKDNPYLVGNISPVPIGKTARQAQREFEEGAASVPSN